MKKEYKSKPSLVSNNQGYFQWDERKAINKEKIEIMVEKSQEKGVQKGRRRKRKYTGFMQ